MKTNRDFIRLIWAAFVLLIFSSQTLAAEVQYKMQWSGNNNYSLQGYFRYEATTSGVTIAAEELTDFYIEVLDPDGASIGDFSFMNIGEPNTKFFFTYDSLDGRMLLTGEVDPNGEHELSSSSVFYGFAMGKLSDDPGQILVSSRMGCDGAFPKEYLPEIDIFVDPNGYCKYLMQRVDTGAVGSEILITLDDTSPNPQHTVYIEVDEGEGQIPAAGGKLQYYAKIDNLDQDNDKTYVQWSTLILPGGEGYGIHKANSVTILAGEIREYKTPRLTIPDWFPTGEYEFKWYVADPANTEEIIQEAVLTFNKL